jgi:iron complex outermembrane receptor protein
MMFRAIRSASIGIASPVLAIWSAAVFLGNVAFAQQATETAASQETGLKEVVVTAERRSERAENVPISLQVISQDDLTKSGIVIFDDLDKISPGVQIGRIGVFTQPSIRGISTSVLGPGEENNVATYIDGFYQAEQLSLSGDLVNLSDVQILKGPQGALYGRNATGGAILISTLDPSYDKFQMNVQGTYGRFNDRGGQLYLNTPITSNAAFNLSVNYRQNDGYIKDLTGIYVAPYPPNTDAAAYWSYGTRAKLKFDIGDNVIVTLGYNYKFFSDNSPNAWNISQYNNGVFPLPAGVGVDVVSQSIPNIYNNTTNTPTLKVEFKTPIGTLASHSQYSREAVNFANDYDGIKQDTIQAGAQIWTRETYQETLDYNITAIDRLNLLTGADFLKDTGLGTSWTKLGYPFIPGLGPTSPAVLTNSAMNNMRTRAFAVYVDGTYSLTDRLFLSAGVRWSDEFKSFTSVNGKEPGQGESLFPGDVTSKSFVNFSPSVRLRYEVAPNSNVYGSISRGFKSGTFNTINTVPSTTPPPPIQPELVTAYEVGFKTNKTPFRFDTAAYFYDYSNLQVSSTTVEANIITAVLQNAATAHIYGVEASGDYSPIEQWNLHLGAAFNKAYYVSYPHATAAVLVGGFITQGQQNWGGYPLPRAPEWTANLGSDYTYPLPMGNLNLALSVSYSSSYVPVSDSYDPASGALLFKQGAYALTNGTVTWNANDHFWLGVYSNNMFNRRYRIYYNYNTFGAYDSENQPVTYGLKVGINY